MKVYEFSTTITPDGRLVIPDAYRQTVPVGDSVRVILLVDEEIAVVSVGSDSSTTLSVAEVIDEIKRSPQNPATVQQASGLLLEHLTHSPQIPDPDFDVAAWNRQWDEIEAKMKQMELEDQDIEADFKLP